MEYRKLGRTGLMISPIGLGTVNFSWLTNEADSFAILDRAFELGVNFIDTSDNYNAGQTEALLGRWFALGGGRREKTVLAIEGVLAADGVGVERPGEAHGHAGSGRINAACRRSTSAKRAMRA